MRHVGPKLEAVKLLISSVADGKWLKRVGDEIVGVDQPGAEVFTDLSDVPSDYTSHGGKYVAVNSGATALEFVDAPGGGFGNLDGGHATSVFGGTTALDGGAA